MSYRHRPEQSLAPWQPSGMIAPTAQNMQEKTEMLQRPKRVACKECRQAKLRCDGPTNKNTSACVRCRRLSLSCEIDKGYKRVSKRLKITELTEEVERLRSAVDRSGLGNLNISALGMLSDQTPSHINNHGAASTFHPQPADLFPKPNTVSQCQSPSTPILPISSSSFSGRPLSSQSRCLEHINLSKARIDDLFRIFFEHYHSFFDILDPTISPDEYYSRSKLLFWSITTIASRHYPQDATLFSDLNQGVTKLMWNSISILPHTRYIIQAILLLSLWSFPTNSMSTDPSFILVSIAKSASMQLGIHRPEIIQDFMRVKTQLSSWEFEDAVKTWVGSFIAAQSVTTSIGQSTLLHADWVIEAACVQNSKYALPENLRHHLLISKFITRINHVLADEKNLETNRIRDRDICILINVLEQDYIDLNLQLGQGLSEMHQILLVMAALQLNTYYFFISTDQEMRKLGLLKAYTTSLDLISKSMEANEKSDFIRYAPDGYGQSLVLAAVLLMRIIHSSYSKFIDVNEGKRAFDSLLRMFRRASIENNDLRGRIGKILTQLWSFHQTHARKGILGEPKLNIKTRLGASLLHDSLWTWREEFGGEKGTERAIAPSASSQGMPGISEHTPASIANTSPSILGSMDSQNLQQSNVNLAVLTPLVEIGHDYEAQDMDWLWDVGFPSFLPLDFNSYEPQEIGFQ